MEEHLRGRLMLAKCIKQLRAKGEKLTFAELMPAPRTPPRDLKEFYAAAPQLTNQVASTGNDVNLPNGQALARTTPVVLVCPLV